MQISHPDPDGITVPPGLADRMYLKKSEPPVLYVATHARADLPVQAFARLYTDVVPDAALIFVPLDQIHALRRGDSVGADLELTPPQRKVVELFRRAVERKASDIHLGIGEEDVTIVRFRIHGRLIRVDSLASEEGEQLASTIIQSMCDVTEAQFNSRRPQDGRIESKYLNGLNLFGARYAHTPTVDGLQVVMRLIPDDSDNPPTLEDLGFLPAQRAEMEKAVYTPEGVLILSGPTGSGKSATLRTLGNMYLKTHQYMLNLVTYEDPPEGRIRGAIQCPIIADKNDPDEVLRAWLLYLSNTLRIDPDAILIGEMRDAFSAQACIRNAMTGHLVLTTLHANDPFNILERLLSLDVRPELLTDPQLFTGLISQRLVPLLCPYCCEKWDDVVGYMSDMRREQLEASCDRVAVRFRRRGGCERCEDGVTGRTVVSEIIRPDARFMMIYQKQGKLAARDYWIRGLGGITRNQHVLMLVNAGRVDPRAAEKVCALDEDRRLSVGESEDERLAG